MDFLVGDKITWTSPRTDITYTGVITEVYPTTVFANMDDDFKDCYGMKSYLFRKDQINLKTTISKEQRLLNKCKTLWNKSNYVINNPNKAY